MATLPHHLLLLLLFISTSITTTTSSSSSSEQDLLLSFKSSIINGSHQSLSNWSPNTPTCNWTGISCSTSSPPSITSIDLQGLNLTGSISSSICQLPHLSHLNLANNLLSQPIPLHLSQCSSLISLNFSNSLLWGTLPDQVSQITSLTVLDLSHNQIEGQIPLGIGSLKSLQVLNLGSNSFSGAVHSSIFANLTELLLLDLSQNPSLSSELPVELGRLSKVKRIFMQGCGFFAGIPESILALHELEVLDLSRNNLTGRIPLGFGLGLTKLVSVDLSQNKLYGSFPADVCYGKALQEISLHTNSFTGFVPGSIGKCSSLESIQIQDNGFYGEFPAGLWSLPEIRIVRAENNRFSGELPDFVGVPSLLEQIQIDNNSFTGRIPKGIGLINTLYRFSASFNGFHGSVPLSLVSGLPASFLQGNPGLCGPGLPNQCIKTERKKSSRSSGLIFAAIAIAFAFGFMLLALGLFAVHRLSCKKSLTSNWKSVFFYSLGIREDELLMSLDEKNIIGRGTFGDVYKIKLPTGECIAVKKLSNSGKLSFRTAKAEIRKLAKTRQKNLTKLLGFCHSENVVLLIHEYLSNGSLGDSLCNLESPLELTVRMHIALGAAQEQGCSKKATDQMDVYSFGVVLLELITGRKAEMPEPRESIDIVTWVRRKINMTNATHQILDPNISNSFQQEMLVSWN
ncbi:hypothetical protein J5N97_005412 [Dioscorea zingiberensis]|uniref:Protein kinase domain-containing protein n=1 Tax=Dioscorea zingiberensis TaxID=325984 RepID=A0A9D5D8I0_9LILI|nr:hypothetical protein J5N97_005412 [Dioscorea zingiberensis]